MFLAPLPANYVGSRLSAPTGKWKDGLFDCFSEGYFHPSLWCSLCCTQLAMAQVISRMQLTWTGEPGSFYSSSRAFPAILLLVASYFSYSMALELAALPYSVLNVPPYIAGLRFGGNFLFMFWSIYALCRTRENVRARYQIKEERCQGCEDLCCAMWCGCCTTAQMMRHTGEYEVYPGVCCSRTGHPPGTPLVI
jgi:Cys-rich protein (TIGR01571 family)